MCLERQNSYRNVDEDDLIKPRNESVGSECSSSKSVGSKHFWYLFCWIVDKEIFCSIKLRPFTGTELLIDWLTIFNESIERSTNDNLHIFNCKYVDMKRKTKMSLTQMMDHYCEKLLHYKHNTKFVYLLSSIEMDELFLFHEQHYDYFYLFLNHNQRINNLLLNITRDEDQHNHINYIFTTKEQFHQKKFFSIEENKFQ